MDRITFESNLMFIYRIYILQGRSGTCNMKDMTVKNPKNCIICILQIL